VGSVDEEVRRMRIVVGGLMAGLLFFGGLSFFVGPIAPLQSELRWPLLVAVGAFGVFAAFAHGAFRRALVRRLAARSTELKQAADPASLVAGDYRALVIVGGGLIEGPGFLAGIAYLMTHDPYALAALGLAVVLLVAHLPSAARLRLLAEQAAQS
jgi:hypothetical protein